MIGSRDGIKTPDTVAGLSPVGIHEPTNAELATGNTGDDLVLDDQWCRLLVVAVFRVSRLRVPDHAAGLGVECHDMGIHRAHKQAVARNRDTAITRSATEVEFVWQRMIVSPERPSTLGIESDDTTW